MSPSSRRFIIHATVASRLYSSKRGKIVKDYLEKKALVDWAMNTEGVDSAGAATARVTGAGHSGGTYASEPFHLDVQVGDTKNGDIIKTINPHTNKKAKIWHVYIGSNKDNLYALASAWHESLAEASWEEVVL